MKLPNEIEQAIKTHRDPWAKCPELGIDDMRTGARIAIEHVRAVILGTKKRYSSDLFPTTTAVREELRQELLSALGMKEDE